MDTVSDVRIVWAADEELEDRLTNERYKVCSSLLPSLVESCRCRGSCVVAIVHAPKPHTPHPETGVEEERAVPLRNHDLAPPRVALPHRPVAARQDPVFAPPPRCPASSSVSVYSGAPIFV